MGALVGRGGRRFWRDSRQESIGFGNNPDMSVWCEGDVGVEHNMETVSLSVLRARYSQQGGLW